MVLDGFMLDWAWLMASFFIGIFLGCMTGLIPGFHVNNVALIALSMSPLAVGAGIPPRANFAGALAQRPGLQPRAIPRAR